MSKVRMLHPSSGRKNFNVVKKRTAPNANNTNQPSQATSENPTVDKKQLEQQTKNAIQVAAASQTGK